MKIGRIIMYKLGRQKKLYGSSIYISGKYKEGKERKRLPMTAITDLGKQLRKLGTDG
ncbi:MAG: hypothetical protein ABIW34_09835 [Ginsengibacter sp.]